MKKATIAFLVFNVLFLLGNIKLLRSIWDANTQLRGREAKQVIHEYIHGMRTGNADFSFHVDSGVTCDPNRVGQPYTIDRAYPNGLFTPGSSYWVIDLSFKDGSKCQAEVCCIRDSQWALSSWNHFKKRQQDGPNRPAGAPAAGES